MTETVQVAMDKEVVREKITLAALKHVPFHGWTLISLNLGARDVGYDHDTVQRVFRMGLAQWVESWSRWADRYMLESIYEPDFNMMRVRDRIATCIRVRIMANAEHRDALLRCISWLSIPYNIPIATKNTLHTVNNIWYLAGDRSVDWNYYTKRGLLIPIYVTTVLYWLADREDNNGDYPNTWNYLDRRIEGVLKTFSIPRVVKERVEKMISCQL